MAKNRKEIPEDIKREMIITLAKEIARHINFTSSYDITRDCTLVQARIRLPGSLEVTQLFTDEMYEDFPD